MVGVINNIKVFDIKLPFLLLFACNPRWNFMFFTCLCTGSKDILLEDKQAEMASASYL